MTLIVQNDIALYISTKIERRHCDRRFVVFRYLNGDVVFVYLTREAECVICGLRHKETSLHYTLWACVVASCSFTVLSTFC